MLQIVDRPLPAEAISVLAEMQALVDAGADYSTQVALASSLWDSKSSTVQRRGAFLSVRRTLARMCVGTIRCSYCEDSLADEIEHVKPKNFFPDSAFRWENYLFSCGPCNGPKSNRYGYVSGDTVTEFFRGRNSPIIAPPSGASALIDPRSENPLDYLELDLGGVTQNGMELRPTFTMLPAEGLAAVEAARAVFTIDVLGLNREVIRVARENAFGGFRARLLEYVHKLETGGSADELGTHRDDLLKTPHLTVFAEMRRQRARLPEINNLFERAPQACTWPLTVAV